MSSTYEADCCAHAYSEGEIHGVASNLLEQKVRIQRLLDRVVEEYNVGAFRKVTLASLHIGFDRGENRLLVSPAVMNFMLKIVAADTLDDALTQLEQWDFARSCSRQPCDEAPR